MQLDDEGQSRRDFLEGTMDIRYRRLEPIAV